MKSQFISKSKNLRKIGSLGECVVDEFLQSLNWKIHKKNVCFRGGEIDRIYWNPVSSEYCLAEIKTQKLKAFDCSQESFQKFFKIRQRENLISYAENHIATDRIVLRYFFVFYFQKGDCCPSQIDDFKEQMQDAHLRFLGQSQNTLLFSLPLQLLY